ncbi:hypothetical protein [Rhodococcus sp. PSBB049]|uniref:hypothetical protein n=1 Tax=Rhodococcus sp. PSBB049 TaxID=2812863 RepID=UPI00197D3223|nr:hypothetical protein [Rhodococcus sp. PSBB049]QSE72464.1 hypothetical protein JYA91_29520 [Rhodococcus sp. PSBB049]
MIRKSIATAMITAAAAVGTAGCSGETPGDSPSVGPITSVADVPAGPFDDSGLIAQVQRRNVTAIVETVRMRGGDDDDILAALIAGKAETEWLSGSSNGAPGDLQDIYGWWFRYNLAVDSTEAVVAATHSFMDVATTVTGNKNDPVAHSLAVQHADPRRYDEKYHFPREGAAAEAAYREALPSAQAALEELANE